MSTGIDDFPPNPNPPSPRTPEWTFGDRLRKARRGAHLTQGQLAEIVGVSDKRLASWESDLHLPKPSEAQVICRAIAKATYVPTAWLAFGNILGDEPLEHEGDWERTAPGYVTVYGETYSHRSAQTEQYPDSTTRWAQLSLLDEAPIIWVPRPAPELSFDQAA